MGKGSSKGHTPREAKDNLKSTQLLSVIDAISEGPVEGPVEGLKSVLLNSTPVLDTCFIFWGKTVQCWQSNSLTKQSVQNDCPCRFRNSFFKGKQHEN